MGSWRSAAAVVAVALSVGGCSVAKGGEASGGFVSGDGTITRVAADDREPAPEVSGDDLDGEPLSLADYEGKTVILNVWGSWCGDCRVESDDLVTAAEELKADGVRVLGLTTRDTLENARRYVEEEGLTFPSIQDPDGQLLLGFADSLNAVATPTTWIIDEQGRVAARIAGTTTASTLAGLVEDVQADG